MKHSFSNTSTLYKNTNSSLVNKPDENADLKKGIWIYFLLLIFEGALRKWILPGLSNPLLIVRDPVAIWLLIKAFNRGLLPNKTTLVIMVSIGVFSIFTAMVFGHGNLFIAIYGARILLVHFPMIFIVGSIFNYDDVIKIGKATLLISIPMIVLVAMQFYSPQSALVNRGVGGNIEGAGFSGALGFFRPPGTFSFTNGNTLFFSFVAPFVFFFLINAQYVKKIILILATLALLSSIPLSISRSLFFSVCITAMFTVISTFYKPEYLGKIVMALFIVIISLAILSQTSMFQTAAEAFISRLNGANEAEGGMEGVVMDRYLGGMIGALASSGKFSFWGLGIGIGSNVAGMLTTGDTTKVISEGDWGRWIGELGAFLGMAVIFVRIAVSFDLFKVSFATMKSGNFLPWILLSFALTTMPQGDLSQPTAMGFTYFIGGLVYAAVNKKAVKKAETKFDVNSTKVKTYHRFAPIKIKKKPYEV